MKTSGSPTTYFATIASVRDDGARISASAFTIDALDETDPDYVFREEMGVRFAGASRIEGPLTMVLVALQKIREVVLPGDVVLVEILGCPEDMRRIAGLCEHYAQLLAGVDREIAWIEELGGRVLLEDLTGASETLLTALDLAEAALEDPEPGRAALRSHLAA